MDLYHWLEMKLLGRDKRDYRTMPGRRTGSGPYDYVPPVTYHDPPDADTLRRRQWQDAHPFDPRLRKAWTTFAIKIGLGISAGDEGYVRRMLTHVGKSADRIAIIDHWKAAHGFEAVANMETILSDLRQRETWGRDPDALARNREQRARRPRAGKRCECGGTLVRRTRGSDRRPFLGCSRYPACRVTSPIGGR